MKTIAILSGFDPTNGAGISVDIQTAKFLKIYPLAVPSVLTVQNSKQFSYAKIVEPNYIIDSFNSIFEEFSPEILKIGLIPTENEKWLKDVSKILANFKTIIIDPILKPFSAQDFFQPADCFKDFISGKNKILTPNKKELVKLFELIEKKSSKNFSILQMAKTVHLKTNSSLIVKFEREKGEVLILENQKETIVTFDLKDINGEIHGTGCRFSTFLACELVKNKDLTSAVKNAVKFMDKQLENLHKFSNNGQFFII